MRRMQIHFAIQWVMNWNARTDGEEDQRDAERGHSSQRGGNNGCNKAQPTSWLSWCHSTSTSQGNPGVGACGGPQPTMGGLSAWQT
jgi:hypothetical protein